MRLVNTIIAFIALLFGVVGLLTSETVLHEITTALCAVVFLLAQVVNNTMPKVTE
jgi:hypothetical protein